jgi:hypothetical protein
MFREDDAEIDDMSSDRRSSLQASEKMSEERHLRAVKEFQDAVNRDILDWRNPTKIPLAGREEDDF